MDDFERKLKRDAAAIPAGMTLELQSRIRASLEAQAPPRAAARKPLPRRSWLAAGATAAAAAVVAIVLLPQSAQRQTVADVPPAHVVPADAAAIDRALALNVEPAAFTAPLEEELENLRADLEQARRSVAEDVAF